MAGSTIHSLVYRVSTSADLKGIVATRKEINEASRVIRETRTPIEAYKNSLDSLSNLHKKGALDAETHRRAIHKLNQEYKEARAVGPALAKQVTGAGVAGAASSALGAIGVGVGVGSAVAMAKESITLAEDQILQEKKLSAVLEATGHASGFRASEMISQAKDTERATGVSDNAIMKSQAVMATFRNIQGSVFTEGVQLALDMSRVMEKDTASSALMLGKALNDPIKGVSALAEAGVQFTDQQKEVIASLVEVGDVAGAQRVILAEFASEFGGAAVKMKSPIDDAKNSVTSLKEEIGRLATETDTGRGILNYFSKGYQSLADDIKAAREGSRSFFMTAWSPLGSGLSMATPGPGAPEMPPEPPPAATEAKDTPEEIAEAKRRRAGRRRVDVENLGRDDLAKADKTVAGIEAKRDRELARKAEERTSFLENLLKTPADRKREELDKGLGTIKEALDKEEIGPTEAAAAEQALAREVFGADEKPDAAEAKKKEPPRDAGAANLRGSEGAFSAIIKGMSRGTSTEEVPKKQLNVAEKQFSTAEETLAEIKKAATKPATPIQVINF